MAIHTNPIFDGYRGSVNQQLLFRQCGGKTVVSKWPDRSKVVYSPQQLNERQRFKDAVAYARVIVKLPLMKARYSDLASKLGFRSAWNAAIAEFMSKTELKQKPKKVWFNASIISNELGDGIQVKLYKLVYLVEVSQKLNKVPLRDNYECDIIPLWPLHSTRSSGALFPGILAAGVRAIPNSCSG